LANLKWFSQKSGYELNIVNSGNYGQWLPDDRKKKVTDLLKDIQIGDDRKDLKDKVKI